MEGTEGLAVSSVTTYSDKASKPTLVIILGDYTLYLYSQTAAED